jgi:hypothetical protein
LNSTGVLAFASIELRRASSRFVKQAGYGIQLSEHIHGDGTEILLHATRRPRMNCIDHRDGVHADIDVVAELRQQVHHIAVDRRENARALEIHLCLVELGFGLRE